MDLTLLADEVWAASKEMQARAHDTPFSEARQAYLEAHYNLQTAVAQIQRAIDWIGRAGG